LVLMFLAICRTVLLIPSVILLEVTQNFRFRPNSSLVPIGTLLFLHKLWKVKLWGWQDCIEGVFHPNGLSHCDICRLYNEILEPYMSFNRMTTAMS